MPHYVSLQKKWTLFRFARKTDGFFVSPPFSSRLSLVLAFVDIASIGTSQSYSLEHQNVTADAFFRRFLLTNSLSFALVDSGTSQVRKLAQVSKNDVLGLFWLIWDLFPSSSGRKLRIFD